MVAVHVALLEGPVPRGVGVSALLYGVAYRPTLVATVVVFRRRTR